MIEASNDSSFTPTVMIVEDEPSLQRLLRMAFTAAHIHVVQAYTGSEALQLLEANRPHAIILDLGLPDGRGGDVLSWLLRSHDSMPWLAISAMDRQEVEQRYGDLGNHFVAKPFNPWSLVERVEQLFSNLA